MKVAVTGGSGFIGSHVVDKLVAAGHRVVVIDKNPPTRPGATFKEVDIADLPGLVRATAGCDAVFHLAGVANVNDALADPSGTFEINVAGTARVWEAARRNQVSRTVLASTVWVYSAAVGSGPVSEDTPFDIGTSGHVYTASKIAAELVATSYGELYKQPFTILRYGIPYGPRMREELVLPRFVRAAMAGEKITIQGDGLQYRNYIYVEDLADAHVRALAEAGENQTFNLEGPEQVSVRRIAELVRELVNPQLEIEFVPARPGDFTGRPVSAEKAERLLGWQASTPFDDGVRRYLDWWPAERDDTAERAGEG